MNLDASLSPEFEDPGLWQSVAAPPPGGSVLDLAQSAGSMLFAASPAGLFRRAPQDEWAPLIQGLPFARLNAVLAAGRTLVVAGLPQGLAHSPDGGRHWQRGWVDQTERPVTCLAASPRFHADRLLLAGTAGDGVLRSTDGGRYWNLSNFGLRNFTVLCLAAAPGWTRREPLFAGTENGLYESPNGGRAWRRLEDGPQGPVLCLAISPNYGTDHTLFAGAEDGRIWCSQDAGKSWTALPVEAGVGPINSLVFTPQGALMAATGAAGLLRRSLDGREWSQVYGPQQPVLSLLAAGERLYAGLHTGGLLVSEDDGCSWQAEPGFAARRFTQLLDFSGALWAAGPQEGVWRLDRELNWQPDTAWPVERPLLALAAGETALLAAAPQGVYRREAQSSGWQPVLAQPASALTAQGDLAWLGTERGQLYFSQDGGQEWQRLPAPFDGPLVALAASADFAQDRTLLAATAHPRQRMIQVWLSRDAGQHWEVWLREHTDWYGVRLAIAGMQASVGFGLTVLSHTPEGWQRAEVGDETGPLRALRLWSSGLRLAAAGERMLLSHDGQHWTRFDDGLKGEALVDLLPAPSFEQDRVVYALGSAGRLWRRVIPTPEQD